MKATEKQKAYHKEWRQKNKERLAIHKHLYYLRVKDGVLRQYQIANEERIRRYRLTHKEETKVRAKTWLGKLREEVLTHYGNGKYACTKCGVSDIRVLTIDHIEGGGMEHRRRISGNLYYSLKKQNYPNGYQTLCMNCQFIKMRERREHKHVKLE